jgi:hypothetical protein
MLGNSEREAFSRLGDTLRRRDGEKTVDDRENARLFSPLEVLLPNENALSRILKYLLDPSAEHGQGRAFLDQFLTSLGATKGELRQLKFLQVTTEYPTTTARRIDVLLRLDGHLIGIENKPWASEGDNQCRDYCRELERLSPGRWTLVFLTVDGRLAESGGEFSDRITSLRYDQIVTAFKTECKRVQQFLFDFTRYVRERIHGEAPASHPWDKQMINEFLRPENIQVTIEILARAKEIRQGLVSLFRDEMLARVRNDFGEDWNADIQNHSDRGVIRAQDFDAQYSGLYFFRPEWKGRYAIGFCNDSANAKNFIFGVYYWGRIQKDRIAAGRLQAALNQVFGTSNGKDYWDWWRRLSALGKPEYNDWYKPDVMKAMALDRGSMTDELYPILRQIITIAEPIIDGEPSRQQR